MIRTLVTVAGLPAGSRVALLCSTRMAARHQLLTLAEREGAVSVDRDGGEKATFPNGTTVHVVPALNVAWRGVSVDVVIAPDGIGSGLLPFVYTALATSRVHPHLARDVDPRELEERFRGASGWPRARSEGYRTARALGNALAGGVVIALPTLLVLLWASR